MFRSATDQQRMIEAAALENAKKALLAYVYQKHPTLVVCEANNRMIVELTADWSGPEIMPTPDAFNAMLAENGEEALSCLVRRPIEKIKQQLIDDILALLASKNGGRDGKFDQFNLRSEKTRMSSWSLDALRNRLQEIRVKQQMSTQPIAALKSFVADSRPNTTTYPALPKTVWNGTAHIPLNAATIKAMDAWEIKRYSRLYGQQQLNDRLKETA